MRYADLDPILEVLVKAGRIMISSELIQQDLDTYILARVHMRS